MTENEKPENERSTAYDLWPNEPPAVASEEKDPFDQPFVPVAYTPEPVDEDVRNQGMAFSMGVVFFGSVAFMLFLGWLIDLLAGSSPWGIVGGIVLGSIIGFIQFFRLSSQMHTPKKTAPEHRPLLSRHDDDE